MSTSLFRHDGRPELKFGLPTKVGSSRLEWAGRLKADFGSEPELQFKADVDTARKLTIAEPHAIIPARKREALRFTYSVDGDNQATAS